ncbi:MAG: GyrI-like domain-containing protein [Alphaproteobacteria bacterium]|nr:GyrI-like domain-containing protein [Alphaproteobacteria bacterium]
MKNIQEPITIVGLELKTSNAIAAETIPLHWQKFYQENILDKISNKISSDIYAVYTHFKNIGKYEECVYSLIIGVAVKTIERLPESLVSFTIMPETRKIFNVKNGPQSVGEKWFEIWQQPLQRTFIADYEHYQSSGTIDIFIGVK